MKYIIMCGGRYGKWETPRHLIEINGEPLVMRTIRLLRSAGVDDIAISAENVAFEKFGVPVLYHDNDYFATPEHSTGHWASAFYLTDEPTCYIFGDDWLIGGSTINQGRGFVARSCRWRDEDLIIQLQNEMVRRRTKS